MVYLAFEVRANLSQSLTQNQLNFSHPIVKQPSLPRSKMFMLYIQEDYNNWSTYLANLNNFNREDLELRSVEAVHKLHPQTYAEPTTNDWLVKACLRQNKFILAIPFHQLDYQKSYQQYISFLHVCHEYPKEVVVLNKLADFMWHSHMQDHQGYRADHLNILGKVLDHIDDFPDDLLITHRKRTNQLHQELASNINTRNGLDNIDAAEFVFENRDNSSIDANDGDGGGSDSCGGSCGSCSG